VLLAEGSTARQRVAVYQERERIARDLHDVIVQRLYAAGVQLDLLGRRVARRHAARLAEAVDQLDETITEIRATVSRLRSADPSPPPATDLFDSVRAEVATAGELLGFAPTLTLTGDPADLPVAIADHARAALREALSNVVRHAGATSVDVQVDRDTAGLRLSVRDNGCGIPADVTRRGLRNIADRAATVGGRCDVESTPNTGTDVTWWVPG
jgi:signal transduction histidine kinase